MKLADKRSYVIKDLKGVADMSNAEIQLNCEYIRCVVEDAISFIKEQDAHIRTIRGQRDKLRREVALKGGEQG